MCAHKCNDVIRSKMQSSKQIYACENVPKGTLFETLSHLLSVFHPHQTRSLVYL